MNGDLAIDFRYMIHPVELCAILFGSFSMCCLFLRFSSTTESRNGSDVMLESKTVTVSRLLAICYSLIK